MVGKSKPANAEEKARMSLIKEQAWCIPCTLIRRPNGSYTTIQHVVEGNKRLGHRYTYGACLWHHQGHVPHGNCRQEMQERFGISLAFSRKEYKAQFASERDMVTLQDKLIELFEKNPWDQYYMPQYVIYELQQLWNELRQKQ